MPYVVAVAGEVQNLLFIFSFNFFYKYTQLKRPVLSRQVEDRKEIHIEKEETTYNIFMHDCVYKQTNTHTLCVRSNIETMLKFTYTTKLL